MPWDWNVAVFCRDERWSIARCIESIADASRNRRTLITLIVNGSGDDSASLALEAAKRRGMPIAVYTIAYGDKANAINRFFHELREPAQCYFFIDAYVKIGDTALVTLEACLTERPDAVAATGVAANGRTMVRATELTLTETGSRRTASCTRCGRTSSIVWWPGDCGCQLGFITGDGRCTGSMALHDLDPLKNGWAATAHRQQSNGDL